MEHGAELPKRCWMPIRPKNATFENSLLYVLDMQKFKEKLLGDMHASETPAASQDGTVRRQP